MGVEVHIRPIAYKHPHSLIVAEVNGDTVGECLDHLIKLFPGIEKDLFNKDGTLLRYVNILVNGENASPENLAKSVRNNDEIHIVPIIEGG